MLWTCPECKGENPESSRYCQSCGRGKEDPFVRKKIQPYQAPSSQAPSSQAPITKINHLANAEHSFNRYLRPIHFSTLEIYSVVTLVAGYVMYVAAGLTFIIGLFTEIGFLGSLLFALIPLAAGFTLHLTSEMISLFLHGQECWFLSAQYTYVNSQLTNELLSHIDSLEKKIQELSKTES